MALAARRAVPCVALAAGLLGGADAARAGGAAAGLPDGTILGQARCDWPDDTYRQYLERAVATYREDAEAAKRARLGIRPQSELAGVLLAEPDWRGRRLYRDYVCERLVYASDGLQVIAYLWRPARVEGRTLPLIVFNRGGVGEQSRLRPNTQFGFWRFVQADYVVLATQYRGNDGGEGRESFGDGDVRDVLNLFPLAERLGYVDVTNVFMLGYSRGAMVTALAVRRGAPVNAVATVGGLFDLVAAAAERPQLRELVAGAPVDPARVEAALRERSAVYWPEQIGVPMLLLHGGADGVARAATQSLAFAQRLAERRAPYQLVIYDGDTHGLTFSAQDRDLRILDFFARWRRAPEPAAPAPAGPATGAATP
ncbi:MAG: prolyl oligopeptidase family serine peptidase [Steroidobacteraceae bacterium]|nr:prolyl oligopeptidase family serine peptidase [Steroidobacteraceae bacterium]